MNPTAVDIVVSSRLPTLVWVNGFELGASESFDVVELSLFLDEGLGEEGIIDDVIKPSLDWLRHLARVARRIVSDEGCDCVVVLGHIDEQALQRGSSGEDASSLEIGKTVFASGILASLDTEEFLDGLDGLADHDVEFNLLHERSLRRCTQMA